MFRALAVTVMLAIATQFAFAQPVKEDTQSLYDKCRQPSPSVNLAYCIGFLSGAAQQMFWLGAHLDDAKNDDDRTLMSFFSACPKATVSNAAMLQAFINWAQKHPEKWDAEKQLGVMEAIRTTWPCSF